ncbi:MAG TPA: ATP-binding protein [Methylococcus sp.]|nr:ATP-binding protein [Methylococcus sp.]
MHLQHKRIAPDDAALAPKAATSEASFADFLEQLLAHECACRQKRSRQTLARMACFPGIRTLGEFDFGLASGAPKAQRCSTGCCTTPPS